MYLSAILLSAYLNLTLAAFAMHIEAVQWFLLKCTYCCEFVSKTWSWLKGTFLSEYLPPNSTGFILALCEYLVSCFQLENSMEETF